MTHIIALDGQWEGLRAFPRPLRTPDQRKRLEAALDRLGGLYEQMATRAALLTAGMDRVDGLRAGMIDQLDAMDTDPDLEPWLGTGAYGGDDRELDLSDKEPSLCGITCNPLFADAWDLEVEHDGREPDVDKEPSLCGIHMNLAALALDDCEEQSEDEGHDTDREPSFGGVTMATLGHDECSELGTPETYEAGQ